MHWMQGLLITLPAPTCELMLGRFLYDFLVMTGWIAKSIEYDMNEKEFNEGVSFIVIVSLLYYNKL